MPECGCNFIFIVYSLPFNLISFTIFFLSLINSSLGISLIVLPFCLGSLFILYYTIAIWVNRTYITVNDKAIVVRHKPLPLPTCHNLIKKLVKLENLYLKSQTKKARMVLIRVINCWQELLIILIRSYLIFLV